MLGILQSTWVWLSLLGIAAFLVLFWALRGAPPGQAVENEGETDEAPSAGYRDRVVAVAGAGLILVGIGADVAFRYGVPWSLPLFFVGFGIVIALVSVNRRYRHASPTLRRVVDFSNNALNASLVAGILIVGNVLAFKYGGRTIDFTQERTFSLSSLTVNQLKTLQRPVTYTVFLTNSEAASRVLQLLKLYRQENPRFVRVETVSVYSDPRAIERLQKRVPELSVALDQGGGVAVEYGEGESAEHVVAFAAELFSATSPGTRPDPARIETNFNGEDVLTSALIRLREGKKVSVGFVSGHGESSTDAMEPRQPGLGRFKSRLQALGAKVFEQNLLRSDVPSGTSLVVIAGPRTPFQPEEVGRLKSYLDGGGHLLLLVGQGKNGLEEMLLKYNIEIRPVTVYEPTQHPRGLPYVLVEFLIGLKNPIVQSLERQFVFVPYASPIVILGSPAAQAIKSPDPNPSAVVEPILRSTNEAWGESQPTSSAPKRDKEDMPGPFNLAVAVTELPTHTGEPGSASAGGADAKKPSASGEKASEEPPAEPAPRLVVISSRDFAENAMLFQNETNLDLLMNSVNWLRGRPELAGIAPKTHVGQALVADEALRVRIVWVPTLLSILVIVLVGGGMYMSRRT